MPIDPNIILGGQTKPVDPLAVASQFAGLQNAMNQNKLFQQQFSGKQAMGRAVKAATDPTTGQTDYNKFLAGLSQDPDGNYLLPEAAHQAIENQRSQAQLSQEQASAFNAHLGVVAPALTELLSRPQPLTYDDVAKAAANVFGHPDYPGGLRQDLIKDSVGLLTDVKQVADAAGQDPKAQDAAIRNVLGGVASRMENTRAQLAQITGAPMSTDVGPGVVQQAFSPQSGLHTIGFLGKGLSPDQVSQPIKVVDPTTGQETSTTLGDWLNKGYGGHPPVSGPGLGGPAPAFTPTATNMAPGAQTGVVQDAAANVAQGQALQSAAAGAPDRKSILKNMRAELPNFDTGPASKAHGFLGQLADQFGVADKSWEEAQSARESFSKLAYQIANQQRSALGGHGTDSQTEAAMHASPSDFLTRLGNEKVIALLNGNEDALAAKNAAWQTYKRKHGASSFDTFTAGFNRYYDPQAFQWSYMTPGQQSEVKADLTKHGEWSGFQQKLQFATKLKAMAGTE